MLQAHQYSDLHRLIWVCGIIGTVGAAAGVCYGIVKWMSAVYAKSSEIVGNISKIHDVSIQSDETAKCVAETKLTVDLIQTNHLAHLQAGIEEVARTNAELVELTRDVRDGIIKLVDRDTRS